MARPREFDKQVVLDRAMDVFWRLGYDGASMSELTTHMGINSPSLYAAFGNKRALFDQVLDRYQERRLPHRDWVVAADSARETAHRMLMGAADWLTAADEPPGCLLIQCGLGTSSTGDGLPEAVAVRRAGIVTLLNERFELARTEGELPRSADCLTLANYFYNVFCGMAIRAASGSSRDELEKTVDMAMLAWPAGSKGAARKARKR